MQSNIETLVDMTTNYETMEEFYNQISLFSGETHSKESANKNGVKVLTIHSSKGLEFKYVFLPFWVKGVVPMMGFPNTGEEDEEPGCPEEEERRVAFVGLTRARHFVQISWYKRREMYGAFTERSVDVNPSDFIN